MANRLCETGNLIICLRGGLTTRIMVMAQNGEWLVVDRVRLARQEAARILKQKPQAQGPGLRLLTVVYPAIPEVYWLLCLAIKLLS